MKTNRHSFISGIFQLGSAVSIVFFLQGCFCKECASAVSQQKTGERTIPQYALNNQNRNESGSENVVDTGDIAASVGTPQQDAIYANTSMEEGIVFSQEEHLHANMSEVNTTVTIDPPAHKRTVKYEDRQMKIEKFLATKLIAGKSCPLGIRSISTEIIAGPNMSFKSSKEGDDVYGGNDHKHKAGAGFQLGMRSNLGFTDKFSVSPALLLKQNNASEKIKYTYTEPGSVSEESTDKYSYTSLSVPIVANYQVGKQVQVFAGPEFNYLLNASVKSKGGNGGDNKENITKNSAKVGVGVQAGVKYKIPSGNGNSPFGVQLLYEHRLSRLNKKNPDGYGNYNSPAWNMKGFQLGVTCSICELMKGRN